MHFASVLASLLMGAAVTAQTVHVVSVSDLSGKLLQFSPDNLKAAVGDMVQFQYRGGNHTATQSTFDQPCQPIAMNSPSTVGIFSGFQPVAAAQGKIPVFTIMVNDTKPIWLYCSQGKHCQGGMTMVINENTAANSSRSLANFRALAKDAAVNLPGTAVSGGAATAIPSGSATGTGQGAPQKTTVNAASPAIIPTTLSFLGVLAALLLA